jgi:hypothetical protein
MAQGTPETGTRDKKNSFPLACHRPHSYWAADTRGMHVSTVLCCEAIKSIAKQGRRVEGGPKHKWPGMPGKGFRHLEILL